MRSEILNEIKELNAYIIYWKNVRDYNCVNPLPDQKLQNTMMKIYNEIINARKDEMCTKISTLFKMN